MSTIKDKDLAAFMDKVIARNPGEPEFHQAVHEVAMDISPYIQDKDDIKNWFNNKDYAQSTIIIERIERLEKTLQTTLLKELSETIPINFSYLAFREHR